jgi:hypothetical protein
MIYSYMARPFRVFQVDLHRGLVRTRREKRYTTRAIRHLKAFPNFQGGFLAYHEGGTSFMAEVEMQISDRVLGFDETKGNQRTTHLYGPTSLWRRSPMADFYETTGICWATSGGAGLSADGVRVVVETFCQESGIAPGDIGLGQYFSKVHPPFCTWSPAHQTCTGWAIFDTTRGSLRLTTELAADFPGFVALALAAARRQGMSSVVTELEAFALTISDLREKPVENQSPTALREVDNWVTLIAPGETAILLVDSGEPLEVKVVGHVYTPTGLHYRYLAGNVGDPAVLPARYFQVMYGDTRLIEVNLLTGDERQAA